MKTLNTLLATSLLLIGASAANAYDFEQNERVVLQTQSTPNRGEAYQMGVDKLTQLQSASPRQLFNELDIFSLDADESSTRIKDGAYVTVQERVQANGKPVFVGLVNIDVTYTENRDSDND